ncbi:hypothetical protein PHYBLDRAFT_147352 [Phycomyces blakesleeanus NRRL 1555(-)]|uniref:Uncharacterized protein n=1 Tax=Phycomyces blakesleeanus (strain ATCC 8743b / DSM 1359 / FGSC 10004 / NBRC 33097 / NRRL 1555) TaxID=763407 RepID=A0A167M2W7_PHYB8|nr:hypothetical protein PHYBLDRAFT_147352 [Phycomyces blakesleeanus NRRL 1555(-)]OAD71607.1 hypothetical protein PHYBLDRAFT_147352 [Phycomyces blakesleeanus NRRL 1555(-)]|eukprot:XP_018289647.1 hypothetical protein PHYBLDRAFT_147352 [Phycomyces blakesleeanus NRRL 1555(-)]
MSHLPGVLFFWKDPERPIDMILLQSDQSKSFVLLSDSAVINTHSQQVGLVMSDATDSTTTTTTKYTVWPELNHGPKLNLGQYRDL